MIIKIQRFFSSRKHIESLLSDYSNIPHHILSQTDRQLYMNHEHPLGILKNKISQFYQKQDFEILDSLSKVVQVKNNFDDLLVPKDHSSRKKSESYYLTENLMLRPHTSVHQIETLKKGTNNFCIFGDVYRRDSIDKTHYPIFHQMEAVKIFKDEMDDKVIMDDLKQTTEQLIQHLFGNIKMKWVEAYFPFTNPSLELEIYFQDDWLEVLGCGVIEKKVLDNAGRTQKGWAAGLGLERFAMLLFNIPDIRLFWSEDSRFLDQFKDQQIKKFQPFSKYPICYKDISFFIPENWEDNDLFQLIRNQGGDLIESVELKDNFALKNGKISKCFRIFYRSLERTLTNQEIDTIQFKIRDLVKSDLKADLR